jgi:hypothetical protein
LNQQLNAASDSLAVPFAFPISLLSSVSLDGWNPEAERGKKPEPEFS